MTSDNKRQGKPRPPLQRAEKQAFLEAYIESNFNFSRACEVIGRHRSTICEQLKSDPEFKAAFDEARGFLAEIALAEAVRRAIHGVEKPVYQRGELVGHVREYSDMLLGKILMALRPEFRDSSKLELSGRDGGAIEFNDAKTAAKLAAILHDAKRRTLLGPSEDISEGEIINDDVTDLV